MPNPSVERTGKWPLGCLVTQALAWAICRPLTSNVGPSTSCKSSIANLCGLASKAAGAEVRLWLNRAWLACKRYERTGGGGQRELKGQGRRGCVQRRLPAKPLTPRRKRAARPLAVSEMARRAGSCKANAQAVGNAEVVAVVRCRGSGSSRREVVGIGSSERLERLVAVSVCAR